jgi:glycosyltransferase involved in cell wall biosynthesis
MATGLLAKRGRDAAEPGEPPDPPELETPLKTSIVTCLDVPATSAGGGAELFRDLYGEKGPLRRACAFMLAPPAPQRGLPGGIRTIKVQGMGAESTAFRLYVSRLRQALADAVPPGDFHVVHLHRLTHGASPALIRTFPQQPKIAIVHGSDLLLAEAHPEQLQVLRATVREASAVVLPTWAMADRLLRLAPGTARRKLHHIPWGIPDQLLADPPLNTRRMQSGHLRLLCAGRFLAHRGGEQLAQAISYLAGAELSVAAPRSDYQRMAPVLRRLRIRARYAGWLRRPELWRRFADYDALLVPAGFPDGASLAALEAQACGLPVVYQSSAGLAEVLGTTALPSDYTEPYRLAHDLRRLRNSPALLSALRAAGRANAARFPISATGTSLQALGKQLC